MKTELIENIGFTEEEYNARTLGEDVASFDEFINAIVAFVEESGGSLEDAVDMANTTLQILKDYGVFLLHFSAL